MFKNKLKFTKIAAGLMISATFLTSVVSPVVFSEWPGETPPKVSVVIPIYNAAPWLQECLESVWAQTLNDAEGKNFEIIGIDDKSTDNSAEILTRFAEGKPNVCAILREANGGPSPARNDGLLHASGEYIGFVDSDDRIEPDMYRHMYDVAIANDADIVQCRMKFINQPSVLGQSAGERLIVTKPYGTLRMFLDRPSGFVTDKLFRHKLITDHSILFDHRLKGPEDTVFAMQCYGNSNCVAHCPEGFYNYRKHEGSISDWKKAGERLNTMANGITFGVEGFLGTIYGPTFKKQLYTYIIGWASSVVDSMEMHLRASAEEKINFAKRVLACLARPDFAEISKDSIAPQYRWLLTRLERVSQATAPSTARVHSRPKRPA